MAANNKNWLHQCLSQTLISIHNDLNANLTPPNWPDILPTAYRTKLKSCKKGLNTKLVNYIKAIEGLDSSKRQEIANALTEQNDIPGLLNCSHDCTMLEELPEIVRVPIRELYEYAFTLLTPLRIRDEQYRIVYNSTHHKVCAFCGCEFFNAPKGRREALDHYLAESIYPFAGVNLHNLAPIGSKCNTQYKLAQDILRKKDGTRRHAFDPFNCTGVSISLNNSLLSDTLDSALVSEWKIDFSPQNEEVDTWDEVYSIRNRYIQNLLLPSFNTWLQEFMNYCKRLRNNDSINLSHPDIVLSLTTSYYETLCLAGIADFAFLKCAVFGWLLKLYNEENQRIVLLMKDLYNGDDNSLASAAPVYSVSV